MRNKTDYTLLELSNQWRNPADILSLLLLIGGDIVQKALAQMTGPCAKPFGWRGPCISVAPVAFSFGWVAFSFTILMSALGQRKLMPTVEKPALVMNCANSFARDNHSWVLERLLRDHEARHDLAKTNGSIRIDIFELGKFGDHEEPNPRLDLVWWTGWLTIALQLAIAVAVWISYDNWGVMMVLLSGTLLAFVTSALPQWREEKWAGTQLNKRSAHLLTRGNGHRHVMVFIGGSRSYNLETLATAQSQRRQETPMITLVLAMLWACILICTAGLKENAWPLVGIGGLGMLQNVYAAGSSRSIDWAGLHIRPFHRKSTIIGLRTVQEHDDVDDIFDPQETSADVSELDIWLQHGKARDKMPSWLESMSAAQGAPVWLQPIYDERISRTQGALKELEKWVPTAGLAALKIFFPGSLDYEDRHVRDNVDKKFWKRAWHTKATRRKAEHARIEIGEPVSTYAT